MQIPTYVDRRLAHKPDDLPPMRQDYDGNGSMKLEWRQVATVTIDSATLRLCLAFSSVGHAVTFGLLSDAGDDMQPLPADVSTRIKLVSYTRPEGPISEHAESHPNVGVSLLLLEQAVKYMSKHLERNVDEFVARGEVINSAIARTAREIFGDNLPPADMADEHLLFLCAATKVTDLFFDVQVFGGPNNVGELASAYHWLREQLGGLLGEAAHIMQANLDLLSCLPAAGWDPEAYAQQRHITAHILALLWYFRWANANDVAIMIA